uniref:Uncharacterized protein n=1 Tax=Tetranychus urticae TaxID=32264 RepID=A0A158P4H5_TETUR
MVLSASDRRKLIVSFVSDHPNLSLYECSKQLEHNGINARSPYRVSAKARNKENLTDYNYCGRKPTKMTKRRLNRFKQIAEGWNGSQRELAAKFDISLAYCQELLKEIGIKACKRIDAPKSTPTANKIRSSNVCLDRYLSKRPFRTIFCSCQLCSQCSYVQGRMYREKIGPIYQYVKKIKTHQVYLSLGPSKGFGLI